MWLRRLLIYVHRWLGISGCLLFIAWFVSGLVMMYVRMPEIGAAERRDHLEPLDLSTARASIADTGGADVERVRINMLGGRVVYRFAPGGAGGYHIVYADAGEATAPIDRDQALALARRFAPEQSAALRYASFLTDSDQWTLGSEARRAMPLHRIVLGDAAGTDMYISQPTGEVVMKTTAQERAGRTPARFSTGSISRRSGAAPPSGRGRSSGCRWPAAPSLFPGWCGESGAFRFLRDIGSSANIRTRLTPA